MNSPLIDITTAQQALRDPYTSVDMLGQIAQDYPDSRTAVAAHPGANAQLLAWLDQIGDASVRAVVASRRPAPVQPQPNPWDAPVQPQPTASWQTPSQPQPQPSWQTPTQSQPAASWQTPNPSPAPSQYQPSIRYQDQATQPPASQWPPSSPVTQPEPQPPSQPQWQTSTQSSPTASWQTPSPSPLPAQPQPASSWQTPTQPPTSPSWQTSTPSPAPSQPYEPASWQSSSSYQALSEPQAPTHHQAPTETTQSSAARRQQAPTPPQDQAVSHAASPRQAPVEPPEPFEKQDTGQIKVSAKSWEPAKPLDDDDDEDDDEDTKPKRHGVLIGLGIVVGVVAIALVVWFVVLPILGVGKNPSTPSNTSSRPSGTSSAAVVPDVADQPTWADPVSFGLPDGENVGEIDDSGVAGIVFVSWSGTTSGIEAFDLDTGAALWTLNGYYTFGLASGSNAVINTTYPNNQTAVYDIQSGTAIGSYAGTGTEDDIYLDASRLITFDENTGQLCGREISNLATCAWTASTTMNSMDSSAMFGNGAWINTNNGVLDATNGKAAPFGSDATWNEEGLLPTVSYTSGTDGSVIRVTDDTSTDAKYSDTYTFQQWDTTTDKSTSTELDFSSTVMGDYTTWDNWAIASPLLFTVGRQVGDTQTVLTAYSLQDLSQKWQQTLPNTCSLSIQSLGATSYGISDWGATDCTSGMPSQVIVSASTGDQVWTDPSCTQLSDSASAATLCPVDGGQRVVYVNMGGSLYGYDGSAATFDQLWTLALPSPDAQIFSMGGHIFAASTQANEAWLLTS